MTITAPTANDAAAACQRLRSHLAYLKLPAALDAARDGQLTALEAIEQLIGTEADAAARRKLASRLQWAALPAPWRIEDYDFSAQPGTDEHLIRDLATLRFIDEAASILLSGRREWARRCCRWRWPGPRARPGTRCCSPPART